MRGVAVVGRHRREQRRARCRRLPSLRCARRHRTRFARRSASTRAIRSSVPVQSPPLGTPSVSWQSTRMRSRVPKTCLVARRVCSMGGFHRVPGQRPLREPDGSVPSAERGLRRRGKRREQNECQRDPSHGIHAHQNTGSGRSELAISRSARRSSLAAEEAAERVGSSARKGFGNAAIARATLPLSAVRSGHRLSPATLAPRAAATHALTAIRPMTYGYWETSALIVPPGLGRSPRRCRRVR